MKLHFFTIVGSVLLFTHFYLWLRLVRDTRLSRRAAIVGTGIIICLALALPAARILARQLPLNQSLFLLWPAYLWLGMLFLYFAVFVCADGLKIIWHLLYCLLPAKSRQPPDPARRRFLGRAFAASASVLVWGGAAAGTVQALARPRVVRLRIKLDKLPARFRGFKIVQLSDLHVGEMLRREDLTGIVRTVNQLKPDLIAITGDLVDGTVAQLANELAPLAGLRAGQGTFFVTGNHEYYSGVADWLPVIKEYGITVLDNRRVTLSRGDAKLILAGVSDLWAGRFGSQYAPDFARALGSKPTAWPVILLAHQPAALLQARRYTPPDLILAGHTHGGQIWPFSLLVYLQQPYLKGLYQEGSTQIYVNQGTGFWGPPMRLGTFNEITELILA